MVQKLLGQLQGDGHGEKGIDLRGGGTPRIQAWGSGCSVLLFPLLCRAPMHGEAVAPRVCDPWSTHPVPLVYPQPSESLHLQAERLTGL